MAHARARSTLHPFNTLAAASLAVLLSACGGGGGTSTSAGNEQPLTNSPPGPATIAPPAPAPAPAPVSPAPTPTSFTISGVAATGAPMAGAKVTVTDSAGTEVCDQTTSELGSYSCTVSTSARPPFAIRASSADKQQQLFSTLASAADGTANITPVTTLIVARLVPDGNPANLVDAIRNNPAVVTEQKLQGKIDEVATMLAPLLAAVGDRTDPVRGSFAADGKGHDQILDALQITIRPEAASSNIEVTVKVKPAEDSSPPMTLVFKGNASVAPSLSGTIKTDDLVDNGIVGLLNGLRGRFTACYAEPLSQRINSVSAGATQATGDATAIKAHACKSLFINDDPSAYRDNGLAVGSSGAFSGMFRDSSTRAKFDRFNFEYQLANSDIFMSFRSLTEAGVEGLSALTVRKQGGQLKVVGNQYRYSAGVNPMASIREFPLQPHLTWLGSGYNVSIPNTLDPVTRLPIFREVRVMAPGGRLSLYRPNAGRSNLGVVADDGRQRGNQVQFFGSEFLRPLPANAADSTPASRDGNSGAYFVGKQLNDDELRTLPDQGVWRIEWAHANAEKENVVQYVRTLRRAPTLGEIRKLKFPELTDMFRADLVAHHKATGSGRIVFGAPSQVQPNVFNFATAPGTDAWTVPEGALAPTSISVYGWIASSGSFNNTASVASTDRKGVVRCASQSAADFHCNSEMGVTQFAAGSFIDAFELWARDDRRLEIQRQVNLYTLAD